MSRFVTIAAASLLSSACAERVITEGLEEPFRVHSAQFVEGDLPGSAPLTLAEQAAGEEPNYPLPTPAGTDVVYLRQGLSDTRFYGWSSEETVALAVQIRGEGSGHWLFPAGPADPAQNGALTWDFTADFLESLPAGRHDLLVAAIDEEGRSGTQSETSICINSVVPDNGNACDASVVPPAFVIGLEWDTNVDLDLRVVTPTGAVVDSKNPTTAVRDADGNVDTNAPGVGNIDFDSNKDCQIDGRKREHLVFQGAPSRGRYTVYVNLHRACEERSVHYRVNLHTRTPSDDGYSVSTRPRAEGDLIAVQANGGARDGTFVTQFVLE